MSKELTVCGLCVAVVGCPLSSAKISCEEAITICKKCDYNDSMGHCKVIKVMKLDASNCLLLRRRAQYFRKELIERRNKNLKVLFSMDEEFKTITCGLCHPGEQCPATQQQSILDGIGEYGVSDDCKEYIDKCRNCEYYGHVPNTKSNICVLKLVGKEDTLCPIRNNKKSKKK